MPLLLLLLLAACSDQSSPTTRLAVGAGGRIDLAFGVGDPPVELRGMSFRLRTRDRWLVPADFAPPESRVEGPVVTVTYPGGPAEGPKRVELLFDLADGLAQLRPSVTAGDVALEVEALELTCADLRLPGLADQLLFLQHGYQSWSFTGALRLRAPFRSPLDEMGHSALRAGLGDPVHTRKGVGWWVGLLAADSEGPALVAGAVTARRRRTAILPSLPAHGLGALVLRVGTAGEQVEIPAGKSAELETLVFVADERPTRSLERYASQVALHEQSLRQEKTTDPTGWWSWNIFFDQVTEQQVLDHATLLRDRLEPHGFSLVMLDDGYEKLWGEWESTDPVRFPSGLAGLSQKVRAMGPSIGLWLAPFLVDETTSLAQAHPDWFVQDPTTGKPLQHVQLGVRGTNLVLDPTHPGASGHLKGLFGRLVQQGFSLFKLDFLYAGALPGHRQQAVTGTEALRLGLELVRKAAPAAHINLCGMPVLPAVGRGHSLRFGPDVAFSVAPQGLGQVAHEARNVMARAFLDPLIRSDPDQALVRPPLTLDEARIAATLAAMTGFYSSGDDLTSLDTDRMGLLTDPTLLQIARRGRSAMPLDLLQPSSDEVYISPLTDPGLWSNKPRSVPPSRFYLAGEPAYLALFNWTTTTHKLEVDLATLGHAGAKLREVWSNRGLTVERSRLELELSPHSVALVELTAPD